MHPYGPGNPHPLAGHKIRLNPDGRTFSVLDGPRAGRTGTVTSPTATRPATTTATAPGPPARLPDPFELARRGHGLYRIVPSLKVADDVRRAATRMAAASWFAGGITGAEWPYLLETFKPGEHDSFGRWLALVWRVSDGSQLNAVLRDDLEAQAAIAP